MDYDAFLRSKARRMEPAGIVPAPMPSGLKPHQRDLVTWALRLGRAAIFADTGLGKSRMEIEWARQMGDHTGKPVLILTPLAVARQMEREAEAMGLSLSVIRGSDDLGDATIAACNYERLHRIRPGDFGAVVLDESSIIKHHDAATLGALIAAWAETPYRLCATATPSPNDYTELGTHAEFLGVSSRLEMLSEYFVHDGGRTSDWRLKGHARSAFWRWVATWGALIRRPSDLGHDDAGYILPPLSTHEHVTASPRETVESMGLLVPVPVSTLSDQRTARRASIGPRVAECAALVNGDREPWIVWCDLNAEADALADAIPDAIEVRGSDDIDTKEAALSSFSEGRSRVLITKPSIAGHGVNWQHCARVAFVGMGHSWEAYYQAVRRCWRFGQKRPVDVHLFVGDLEAGVSDNVRRKETDAAEMAVELSRWTREAVRGALVEVA